MPSKASSEKILENHQKDKEVRQPKLPNLLFFVGGAERDRTVGLLNAIQALSQLSYSPMQRLRIFINIARNKLQFQFC